jgi:hypothetical protein
MAGPNSSADLPVGHNCESMAMVIGRSNHLGQKGGDETWHTISRQVLLSRSPAAIGRAGEAPRASAAALRFLPGSCSLDTAGAPTVPGAVENGSCTDHIPITGRDCDPPRGLPSLSEGARDARHAVFIEQGNDGLNESFFQSWCRSEWRQAQGGVPGEQSRIGEIRAAEPLHHNKEKSAEFCGVNRTFPLGHL